MSMFSLCYCFSQYVAPSAACVLFGFLFLPSYWDSWSDTASLFLFFAISFFSNFSSDFPVKHFFSYFLVKLFFRSFLCWSSLRFLLENGSTETTRRTDGELANAEGGHWIPPGGRNGPHLRRNVTVWQEYFWGFGLRDAEQCFGSGRRWLASQEEFSRAFLRHVLQGRLPRGLLSDLFTDPAVGLAQKGVFPGYLAVCIDGFFRKYKNL